MIEILTHNKRITALANLGDWLKQGDTALDTLIQHTSMHNAWFTPAYTQKALQAIANMLTISNLEHWLQPYPNTYTEEPKNVGLILAGNIPLVGFHDILCVLMSGNRALIKMSSQDQQLIPYLLDQLVKQEPTFAGQFRFVERLENFDAVIATGSNNTSRYFEYYFGKVPHIIRKNRNSVAVLNGNENPASLYRLGNDIFDYFGLGCRNVSKIFVPQGYNFSTLFEAIEPFKKVAEHHKYSNNYDYNKSIFLVNGDHHLDNGFVLLRPDSKLASPLAVVYYEEYTGLPSLERLLRDQSDNIQCIVSETPLSVNNQVIAFGQSQQPQLWDYADGIDTMQFLSSL
ncbi:acyl-CoA reductase [Pedobacter sp. BS3]|uniref:acyl-CoA reductase n=1 Tax=Pedobacter sp. BS3 TaxID=2567937 RepID=UPI001659E003|nr:acyl-CoA reductase [Pedobacter sp. BS3]